MLSPATVTLLNLIQSPRSIRWGIPTDTSEQQHLTRGSQSTNAKQTSLAHRTEGFIRRGKEPRIPGGGQKSFLKNRKDPETTNFNPHAVVLVCVLFFLKLVVHVLRRNLHLFMTQECVGVLRAQKRATLLSSSANHKDQEAELTVRRTRTTYWLTNSEISTDEAQNLEQRERLLPPTVLPWASY